MLHLGTLASYPTHKIWTQEGLEAAVALLDAGARGLLASARHLHYLQLDVVPAIEVGAGAGRGEAVQPGAERGGAGRGGGPPLLLLLLSLLSPMTCPGCSGCARPASAAAALTTHP